MEYLAVNEDRKAFARSRSFVLIGGPLNGEERVVDKLSGSVIFYAPGNHRSQIVYEWRTYRMRGDYGLELFDFLILAGLDDREAERLIMPHLVALKLPGIADRPAITR